MGMAGQIKRFGFFAVMLASYLAVAQFSKAESMSAEQVRRDRMNAALSSDRGIAIEGVNVLTLEFKLSPREVNFVDNQISPYQELSLIHI